MTTRTPLSTRPRLLASLLVTAVLVLGACGDDESTPEATPATDSATSVDTIDRSDDTDDETIGVDEVGSDEADADSTSDAADSTSDAVGETTMVDTTFGTIEVPADPQRVVALDAITALLMVSIGVEPDLYADPNGAIILQGLLDQRG
ncbi:MAG: hypothetical protein AAF945_08975, partial [Actinomycetota bacterium]